MEINDSVDLDETTGSEDTAHKFRHYNKKSERVVITDQYQSTNNFRKKLKFKENVDTFEFLKPIYKKKAKSVKSDSLEKFQKEESYNRRSSQSSKNSIKITNNKKLVFDRDNNFLYSYRDNQRSQEEIKAFKIQKRKREQEKEEKKEIKKNQKFFEIFKNLYSLYSMKNIKYKKVDNTSSNTNSNSQNRKTSSHKSKRQKMENNECAYLTTNSNISTIVNPNDYYTNAYVVQQLLQIDPDELRKGNEAEDDNETKEQIKNISKQYSAKKKVNNEKLEELKQKASKTIKRANDLFTKENLEKFMNKDKTNQKVSLDHTPQLDIETTSNINTKDKNLPSLSHTYNSNTNPNRKIDVEIEPRKVLNLVEIIRILIKRKVFYAFYEMYYNEEIWQRYNIAFAYFRAILKQGTFRRIEDYCNYQTYYYAFFRLFTPFIRRNFEYLVNRCHYRKRVEYLEELLKRLFKAKCMEKIYIQACLNGSDEEIAFLDILTKIVKTIVRPHLQMVFDRLKETSMEPLIDMADIKMNTYMYESFEANSYSVEPNSVDNDRLHQLRLLMGEHQQEELFGRKSKREKTLTDKSDVSKKSARSVQDLAKMKPGMKLNLSLEDLSNKSLESNNELNSSGNKKNSQNISLNSLKDTLEKKVLNKQKKEISFQK